MRIPRFWRESPGKLSHYFDERRRLLFGSPRPHVETGPGHLMLSNSLMLRGPEFTLWGINDVFVPGFQC